MIKRSIVLVIAIFLLVGMGCATYEDPVMQQKDVYLQARRHFNDSLIQLNTMIKMQPVEQKDALKAEFAPYVDAMSKALNTWGLVVKKGEINDTVERRAFQEEKAKLLAELSKYLTQ
jgi:hypothetical protein